MTEDSDGMSSEAPLTTFDTRPGKLFEARQLWAFLLESGTPCDGHRWRSWADAQIRAAIDVVPPWLIALSTAATRPEAIHAVLEDIGMAGEELSAHWLERDALTKGFVYARFLDGEITHEQMWAELRRTVDIAEFIDGGEWQRWHGIHANDPLDPLAQNAGWIRHLAWLAVRGENELLRNGDDRRKEPSRTT